MAKKKTTKKNKKLTEDEKEEIKAEGELPKKSVRKRENEQLIWFFVIVAVIFASFLVPYFWIETTKVFEYGGAEWVVEEYDQPTGTIYHGRFAALSGADFMFNVYLRTDPRENDVQTIGTFDKFKNSGVVSMAPEVDECRGELSRVMLDLGSFMKQGIGVGTLEVGSTDPFIALETDRRYALCNTASQSTIVIVDIGEPSVVQDSGNRYCYTIYAEDCNDVTSVEKFIIKSIIDFGGAE
jgi:hypothetical protein